MTALTQKFKLSYPVDGDHIKDLPQILRSQAETIESALSRFDYNGSDPDLVLSRVASLESLTANLEQNMPSVAAYSTVTARALTKNGFTVLGGLSPVITAPEAVTYAGGKFTFLNNCVVTACVTASITPRDMSWVPGHRHFIGIIDNYSGSGSPASAQELSRATFINEDLAAMTYSGYFAAGDSITPVAYTSEANRKMTRVTVSLIAQRANQ